jgi:hypothetical protein
MKDTTRSSAGKVREAAGSGNRAAQNGQLSIAAALGNLPGSEFSGPKVRRRQGGEGCSSCCTGTTLFPFLAMLVLLALVLLIVRSVQSSADVQAAALMEPMDEEALADTSPNKDPQRRSGPPTPAGSPGAKKWKKKGRNGQYVVVNTYSQLATQSDPKTVALRRRRGSTRAEISGEVSTYNNRCPLGITIHADFNSRVTRRLEGKGLVMAKGVPLAEWVDMTVLKEGKESISIPEVEAEAEPPSEPTVKSPTDATTVISEAPRLDGAVSPASPGGAGQSPESTPYFSLTGVTPIQVPGCPLEYIPCRVLQLTLLDQVPPAMKAAMVSLEDDNPQFEFHRFSLRAAREQLQADAGSVPEGDKGLAAATLAAFDTFTPSELKMEIFAWYYLQHRGGFWVDCRFLSASKHSLLKLVRERSAKLVVAVETRTWKLTTECFAAVPGHPLLRRMVRDGIFAAHTKFDAQHMKDSSDVTGSRRLNDHFRVLAKLPYGNYRKDLKPGLKVEGLEGVVVVELYRMSSCLIGAVVPGVRARTNLLTVEQQRLVAALKNETAKMFFNRFGFYPNQSQKLRTANGTKSGEEHLRTSSTSTSASSGTDPSSRNSSVDFLISEWGRQWSLTPEWEFPPRSPLFWTRYPKALEDSWSYRLMLDDGLSLWKKRLTFGDSECRNGLGRLPEVREANQEPDRANYWSSGRKTVDMAPVHPAKLIIPLSETTPGQQIPKRILQTNYRDQVPQGMRRAMQSLMDTNPDYEHVYYSDARIRSYLAQHFDARTLKAFDDLRVGAFRSDLFRYCWLFNEGGVYIDSDMVAVRPLSELIGPRDTFVSAEDCGSGRIYNAFLAATPRHPLMKKVLDLVLHRIEKRIYGDSELSITGPMALSDAFNLWLAQFNSRSKTVPDPPQTERSTSSSTQYPFAVLLSNSSGNIDVVPTQELRFVPFGGGYFPHGVKLVAYNCTERCATGGVGYDPGFHREFVARGGLDAVLVAASKGSFNSSEFTSFATKTELVPQKVMPPGMNRTTILTPQLTIVLESRYPTYKAEVRWYGKGESYSQLWIEKEVFNGDREVKEAIIKDWFEKKGAKQLAELEKAKEKKGRITKYASNSTLVKAMLFIIVAGLALGLFIARHLE